MDETNQLNEWTELNGFEDFPVGAAPGSFEMAGWLGGFRAGGSGGVQQVCPMDSFNT